MMSRIKHPAIIRLTNNRAVAFADSMIYGKRILDQLDPLKHHLFVFPDHSEHAVVHFLIGNRSVVQLADVLCDVVVNYDSGYRSFLGFGILLQIGIQILGNLLQCGFVRKYDLIPLGLDTANASVLLLLELSFSTCIKGLLRCPELVIDPVLIVGVDAVGLILLIVSANAAIVIEMTFVIPAFSLNVVIIDSAEANVISRIKKLTDNEMHVTFKKLHSVPLLVEMRVRIPRGFCHTDFGSGKSIQKLSGTGKYHYLIQIPISDRRIIDKNSRAGTLVLIGAVERFYKWKLNLLFHFLHCSHRLHTFLQDLQPAIR